MNLLTLHGDGPREKARIRIVYALLGTAFFVPLQLYIMEIFFSAAFILGIFYFVKYGVPAYTGKPLVYPALAFAATALVSLAGAPQAWLGLAFYVFTVLQYTVLFLGIVLFVKGEEEKRLFLRVILASAFFVALYGLYQYVHMLTLQETEWVDRSAFPLLRRRMYSTLYNPNLLSCYLLMAMSVAGGYTFWTKDGRERAMSAGLFCLLGLCLLLTYSRGAWMGAAVLVFIFGLVRDKRLWLFFLTVPLVLAFYHGGIVDRLVSIFSYREADTSFAMRLDMWSDAVVMWLDHPFFGIGWGAFKFAYPAYNELIQKAGIVIFHCHNLFLNILAETGIFGFCTFFSFFFGHLRYGRDILRGTAEDSFEYMTATVIITVVAAVAVTGISDDDLFSTQVSMMFWLISSLFCNNNKAYGK